MCGRYEIKISEAELKDIIAEVQKKFPGEELDTSEIFPTNKVPVLVQQSGQPWWQPTIWGFPQYGSKSGVIINARAESVEEKPSFRESFLLRRCAIPATGFYEWTKTTPKSKYLFTLPGEAVLYMVGLVKEVNASQRFVVFTTEANSSVEKIHHRMPVVLRREQITDWLCDVDAARRILTGEMPVLEKVAC